MSASPAVAKPRPDLGTTSPSPPRRDELRRTWARFRRNRGAVAGLIVLLVFLTMALAAPLLAPYSPEAMQLGATLLPPSPTHLLGTDHLGRDILSRLIYRARYSLLI